jgi:hypothetical protein
VSERVVTQNTESSDIWVLKTIDSDDLIFSENSGVSDLFIPVDGQEAIYRADTTILTADTTEYTADYSL